MISLSGRLTIKIIDGRNGAFRVGSLVTDIGEFAVKDKILDQYDEGCYQGLFEVSKIFSSTYSTGSRLVVEVRAVLEHIALVNANTLEQDSIDPLEQDPLDEEKDASDDFSKEESEPESIEPTLTENNDPQKSDASESDDEALFALLWPLQETFKLDPTVDRLVFRQQRDRLKALGYRFVPVGQYWTKA